MSFVYLSIDDVDTYAFRDEPQLTSYQSLHQAILPDMSGKSPSRFRRCTACGMLTHKWEETLEGLKVKKRRCDLGATYDGVTVASQRFKDIYDCNSLTGLRFRQLPDDPIFYDIYPTRAVPFDAEKHITQFVDFCMTCNRFQGVAGATPVYLKAGTLIGPKEFVRTDLEFATREEMHPLLLCGVEAGKILKAAKLRRVYLRSDGKVTPATT
jgi:hypothetical protein